MYVRIAKVFESNRVRERERVRDIDNKVTRITNLLHTENGKESKRKTAINRATIERAA